jgi:hypothetical protein
MITGALTVVMLSATGCAPRPGAHARWHTGWDKPGMTGAQFELDVRDRQIEHQQAYTECMKGKGYVQTPR